MWDSCLELWSYICSISSLMMPEMVMTAEISDIGQFCVHGWYHLFNLRCFSILPRRQTCLGMVFGSKHLSRPSTNCQNLENGCVVHRSIYQVLVPNDWVRPVEKVVCNKFHEVMTAKLHAEALVVKAAAKKNKTQQKSLMRTMKTIHEN